VDSNSMIGGVGDEISLDAVGWESLDSIASS
jgi:hypothetical protein